MTSKQKLDGKKAAEEYNKKKKGKVPSAVLGFIEKNSITGKTEKEMDSLVVSAVRLGDGTLKGEGDKFNEWCEGRGRGGLTDDLIEEMNANPFNAVDSIRKNIPNNPKLWRSWCTYKAGGGRKLV